MKKIFLLLSLFLCSCSKEKYEESIWKIENIKGKTEIKSYTDQNNVIQIQHLYDNQSFNLSKNNVLKIEVSNSGGEYKVNGTKHNSNLIFYSNGTITSL